MRSSGMTIGKRLLVGFGVILVLCIATGVVGYLGANSIAGIAVAELRKMLDKDAAVASHSALARANVVGMRRYEKDIFLNIDSKEKVEEYLNQWKDQYGKTLDRMKDLEKAVTSRKDVDALQTMRAELASYVSGFNKVYERIQSGAIKTSREANEAIGEYKESIHKLESAAKSFSEESTMRMGDVERSIDDAAGRTSRMVTILTLISTVLGTGLSILIMRSITGPLKQIIAGLTGSSHHLAAASGEISLASRQLAEGASEQASSVEETSASLEELSSMTKQNAEHAAEASELMSETAAVVATANGAMEQLTSSMQEMSNASEETSKIIKTIDEIAFQTNLLALNAAVEAARAGEAGAGFAVVADEVRTLAMRAAEAARNTSTLIEGTVRKVHEGAEVVRTASQEFSRVVTSASKMGELVGEITAASSEQAQGIEQINVAVSEMDRVIQQNAANAEESASASQEMNAQAERLKGFVGNLTSMIGGGAQDVRAVIDVKGQGRQPAAPGIFTAADKVVGNGGSTVPRVVPQSPKKRGEDVIPFNDDALKDF